MLTAYLIVTSITILFNAGIAAADLARAKFVLANSAAVQVPASWLPMLGSLKAAGAIGLLVGLMGVRFIGIAAAIGLVLFYVGAVIAHVRARQYATLTAPGLFLGFAAATLALGLGT
ncbi:DoxX-like family protein [Saccharopolyspora antimicrobica]|uniref:DoxX-like family protein n=1 Tax=Saccharopolyspora antimicrobica TaxID=455193 RepID=A0A1I5IDR8_9PSEU|nr:DoxX family protein [Saccharopolyspora antimicrobica]RKT85514.1 DoxX-like protein [Saccharopolyspora antimicrobica]SFO58755.1 DoxX-like family protein [Saccharopolyspora antimicrobica]